MWYNGKKKRPGCGPGIYLTTFYKNGLRLNRIALSKKSDSAEHPSQTAYVLEQVSERGKIIIAFVAVYAVVDCDIANITLGKETLCVIADFQLITPHAGHILYDNGLDLPGFRKSYHFIPQVCQT